ncbi:serine/threonine-protein kinase [Nocardia rhizosphaerae]|uniref:non-specific serine/threonine protein kinase n=1 Tax=Nocardia rhizosphaerae TaxID=1691571 RepID=A0ABV8L2L7_9NOCA
MDTRGTSETFAGYGIERILGRGGMGTVYLARHPRLPRLVALKILNSDLLGDNEIRLRFEREADLVAQLDHPNIVAVQDRGLAGDNLWIAMQYVAGCDAGALGMVDPARAIRIITEIAAALDFAHGRGILHRDVKPANILLSSPEPHQPERVLLADFGIARLRDDVNGLTQTGTFTATLAYASPEQLSGGVLDHRSDQYSLACTLFTLLSGTAPFAATNPVAVIGAHMSAPPPRVSERRPGLPPGLDMVIQRALAKDPRQRFDSCTQFALAAARELSNAAVAPRNRPTPAPTWTPEMLANAQTAITPPGFVPLPRTPQSMAPRPTAPSGQGPLLFALWFAFFALVFTTSGLDYWARWYSIEIVGTAFALLVLVPLGLAARFGFLLGPRVLSVAGVSICLAGSALTLALGDQSFARSATSAVVIASAAAVLGHAMAVQYSARPPRHPDWRIAGSLVGAPVAVVGLIELMYRTGDQGWWDLWSGSYLLQWVPPPAVVAVVLLVARRPAPEIREDAKAPFVWIVGSGLAVLAASVPIMYAQQESPLVIWTSLSLGVIAMTLAIRLVVRGLRDQS